MSWKIDRAASTEVVASKPHTAPDDVAALLKYVAGKLGFPIGKLEPSMAGSPVAGRRRARITPLKGAEEDFAAAVKKYNDSPAS